VIPSAFLITLNKRAQFVYFKKHGLNVVNLKEKAFGSKK